MFTLSNKITKPGTRQATYPVAIATIASVALLAGFGARAASAFGGTTVSQSTPDTTATTDGDEGFPVITADGIVCGAQIYSSIGSSTSPWGWVELIYADYVGWEQAHVSGGYLYGTDYWVRFQGNDDRQGTMNAIGAFVNVSPDNLNTNSHYAASGFEDYNSPFPSTLGGTGSTSTIYEAANYNPYASDPSLLTSSTTVTGNTVGSPWSVLESSNSPIVEWTVGTMYATATCPAGVFVGTSVSNGSGGYQPSTTGWPNATVTVSGTQYEDVNATISVGQTISMSYEYGASNSVASYPGGTGANTWIIDEETTY
jgi:hypothetical protein